MNDVIAPQPGKPSRRTVVTGALWATPVVMGLAAAPAIAASETVNGQAVVNKYPPNVGSNAQGTINLWSAQVWYDPNVFLPIGYNDTPPSATVTWRVVIKDSANQIVGTLVPQHTIPLSRSGNETQGNISLSGFAAGTYTVVSEIISVTYPNPHNGRNFATGPSSESSTIVVS